VVAHDKHVLSLKDNDQSANLAALVDAGIRSFKIEGRYKDMATVKNVTAHYRSCSTPARTPLRPACGLVGPLRYFFTPDPDQGFNRGGTDYFVNGRQIHIGAFDTPKHAGPRTGPGQTARPAVAPRGHDLRTDRCGGEPASLVCARLDAQRPAPRRRRHAGSRPCRSLATTAPRHAGRTTPPPSRKTPSRTWPTCSTTRRVTFTRSMASD
jgi:hypothetical protein